METPKVFASYSHDSDEHVAVFHRPHPRPNIDKGAIRDLRRFLDNAGVTL